MSHALARSAVGLLVFVVIALGFAGGRPVVSGVQAAPADSKIGPGVADAVRAQGQAEVVVALAAAPAIQGAQRNLPALRREVRALQDGVLAALPAASFRSRTRFQAVPALAGTLLNGQGLAALAADQRVAKVDLDVGGGGHLAASVPLIGANQWHAAGVTGAGVVVAVLDSGLDTDHQDLGDDLIAQACFLDNGGSIDGVGLCPNGSDRQTGAGAAEDDAGHGTHVSGIITSGGVRSSVGVAPGAKIVAVKVTAGPSYSGVFYFYSEIVAGLDYIINSRPDVRVINMSLGTNALFSGNCDASTAFNIAGAAAIHTLRQNGVIAFASAGNAGSGTQMTSPACLSEVVSVGATNNADAVASFSNSNAQTDLFAPGVGIVSDAIGNGTTSASGTSMASPHAAGCAALLIEAGVAVTPASIEARLKDSPVRVTASTNGLTFPRIDCAPRGPTSVALTGPATGAAGASLTFSAAVAPPAAVQPLTYTWQLGELAPIVHTGGLSDSVTVSWPTGGIKTVTVTVANTDGSVSASKTVVIVGVAPVFLPQALN